MEDGPVHGPVARVSMVELYDAPALCNSAANSSHAAAAASSGPEPEPTYIRPELYSGGYAPKSNIHYLRSCCGGHVKHDIVAPAFTNSQL